MPEPTDMVNSPPHYKKGKIEVIEHIEDIVRAYRGHNGYMAGCVIKYLARAPFKGNFIEDLKKAQWYMNRLVEGSCP